jgi:hypothetical protein
MKVLGITGAARSGKDTFCKLVKDFLKTKTIISRRLAFADVLKAELDPFIFNNFGFSVFTNDPAKKKIIRPLMVAYGCAKRELSNNKYWIEKIETIIDKTEKDFLNGSNYVYIVTDVRFCDSPTDEVFWLKNWMNGKLINLELILEDGSVLEGANDEEKKRIPILKSHADYQFSWNITREDEQKILDNKQKVFKFLEENPNIWS